MDEMETKRLQEQDRWRKFILITMWTEKINKHRKYLGVLELQKKCRFSYWEQLELILRPYIPELVEEVRFCRTLLGYRITKAGEEYARDRASGLIKMSNALGSSIVRRALRKEADVLYKKALGFGGA
jgi:hypothetical protein